MKTNYQFLSSIANDKIIKILEKVLEDLKSNKNWDRRNSFDVECMYNTYKENFIHNEYEINITIYTSKLDHYLK